MKLLEISICKIKVKKKTKKYLRTLNSKALLFVALSLLGLNHSKPILARRKRTLTKRFNNSGKKALKMSTMLSNPSTRPTCNRHSELAPKILSTEN